MWVRSVVTISLLAMTFSGCLGSEAPAEPGFVSTESLDGLVVSLATAADLVAIGEPVLFMLDAYEEDAAPTNTTGAPTNATADANATEVPVNGTFADATWHFLVFEATASDADNATADANGTAPVAVPIFDLEGTGLPANVTYTFTGLGNHTVRLDVDAPGYAANSVFLNMTVVEEIVEDVVEEIAEPDPCEGVPAQDAITMTGTQAPAVSGAGFYTSNAFTVQPCNTKMTITLTTDLSDPILEVVFPDGTSTEVDNGFVGDAEVFTYEPEGGVPAGDYSADVYGYISVVANYEVSIVFE